MVKAIWNNMVLAESDHTIEFDDTVYFPPDSVNCHYLTESPLTALQYWKGKARYFNIDVNGQVNHAAAWTYPQPWWMARAIKNYVAFWKDVTIIRD